MSAPAISVGIPVYNAARYIEATIASVVAQTWDDFEIIAVDDGSMDDSLKILAAISEPRLRIIKQKNAGPSAARNRVIQEARGTFVAYLDADDLWRPAHLATLLAMAARFPTAGLFGNRYREFTDGQALDERLTTTGVSSIDMSILDDYFAVWARGSAPFHTSTFMVRRALAEQTGGYRQGHHRGEDLEFFVRLALAAPVAAAAYVGGYYRRSPTSLTSKPVLEPDICMTEITRLLADPAQSPNAASLREFYNKLALAHALDALLAGQRTATAKFLQLSRGTQWHRQRWRTIRALLAMPNALRTPALALWKSRRR